MLDVTYAKATVGSMESTKRTFTYSEILEITNNFEKVLGKGGFGTVYHGYIDKTQEAAVKMLSPSSIQGSQQFHAEACMHICQLITIKIQSFIGLKLTCSDLWPSDWPPQIAG